MYIINTSGVSYTINKSLGTGIYTNYLSSIIIPNSGYGILTITFFNSIYLIACSSYS